MTINLDNIDVDAVIDTYVERFRFANRTPRTLENAISILVGQGLGVSIRNDVVRIQNDDRWPDNRYITVAVDDSSFNMTDLCRIMGSEIVHGDRTFEFSTLGKAMGHDRGIDEPEAVSYFEITFTGEA